MLFEHHADWPAYPQGADFRMPLLQLTAFPAGTEFLAIDNIDQSTLFIGCVRGASLDDPFAARNFHVAIWYEDLIEFDKNGFVDGIQPVNEREWEQVRWRRLKADVQRAHRLGAWSTENLCRLSLTLSPMKMIRGMAYSPY